MLLPPTLCCPLHRRRAAATAALSPPRYHRQCCRRAIAAALLLRCPPPPPCCHAAALVSPPPSPCCQCHRQHPRPRHHQSTPLPSPSPPQPPPPPPAATATANATPIALATATAKTALAPALVNVTGPCPEARRAGTAPSPPHVLPPLVVGPRRRGRGSSWSEEEASRTTTVAIAASPYHLSPLSFLPPSPPPPMPPPPRPHPCLRRHYRCSLCRCHCVSNAPVDGWLWCRLSPLAYCVVRRPNLSAPAIVRSSTLSPPGHRPLLLTIASHCPVALLPSINRLRRSRWWLVVAFSAHPAAYRPHHQAENVSSFHPLGLILTYLE
jgi:hypothetical protein